jgi:hypothetical protein
MRAAAAVAVGLLIRVREATAASGSGLAVMRTKSDSLEEPMFLSAWDQAHQAPTEEQPEWRIFRAGNELVIRKLEQRSAICEGDEQLFAGLSEGPDSCGGLCSATPSCRYFSVDGEGFCALFAGCRSPDARMQEFDSFELVRSSFLLS